MGSDGEVEMWKGPGRVPRRPCAEERIFVITAAGEKDMEGGGTIGKEEVAVIARRGLIAPRMRDEDKDELLLNDERTFQKAYEAMDLAKEVEMEEEYMAL